MKRSRLRALSWALTAALVVLASRTLAYALAPSPDPLANELQHEIGGPNLVVVVVLALGIAVALSTAVLWLALIAVRERAALARDFAASPRVRLRGVLSSALTLWLACSLGFAALETYLHAREGLGFHALHCLLGPVHANAIPITAGLALVSAAAHRAVAIWLTWARRVVRRLVAGVPNLRARIALARQPSTAEAPFSPSLAARRSARAPPVLVGS